MEKCSESIQSLANVFNYLQSIQPNNNNDPDYSVDTKEGLLCDEERVYQIDRQIYFAEIEIAQRMQTLKRCKKDLENAKRILCPDSRYATIAD